MRQTSRQASKQASRQGGKDGGTEGGTKKLSGVLLSSHTKQNSVSGGEESISEGGRGRGGKIYVQNEWARKVQGKIKRKGNFSKTRVIQQSL